MGVRFCTSILMFVYFVRWAILMQKLTNWPEIVILHVVLWEKQLILVSLFTFKFFVSLFLFLARVCSLTKIVRVSSTQSFCRTCFKTGLAVRLKPSLKKNPRMKGLKLVTLTKAVELYRKTENNLDRSDNYHFSLFSPGNFRTNLANIFVSL